MAYVLWKEEYSVLNPRFDEQHKGLFKLIDEIYDAMQGGKGNDILIAIIGKLEDYTRSHFREEEQYLEKNDYPGLEEQKSEHKKFIDEIGKFKSDIQNQKMGMSLKIVNFLESWLSHHIKTKDKEYGLYFLKK